MNLSPKAIAAARKLNGRDGSDVDLKAVPFRKEIIDGACWVWALRGGRSLSSINFKSPERFYRDIFNWKRGEEEMSPPLSLNQDIVGNYLEAIEYISIVGENLNSAKRGNKLAQKKVKEALMSACLIVTSQKTLKPKAGNPIKSFYKLHMMTPPGPNSWFNRGLHWGLSISSNNDGGGSRCYIQTVTSAPLSTACTTMWDEHYEQTDIALEKFSDSMIVALG